MSQIVAAETDGYCERRLESRLLQQKMDRERETPAQWMARLEKCRKLYAQKKSIQKNNEDVVPVEPLVVIKEEPTEFVPEPFPSEDKDIQNVKEDNGDAVPVQPAVFIKQEPREFDPQPSASADVVIKEEFVVSDEHYTGSSAHAPSSTEPTSRVTLSVACLGPSQKFDKGQ
ncbi:hypothetical protein CDAR_470541 [Caerostris darwini]|uniref:Uncharacterized protein n=1 Tax=Caerostris darwini TaxID=1538125 RepID=A0AAV4VIV9_9ARAC|nr:hypothetical protein CDAR_470541 [Caerostris darwini]